jgi:nitrogen fixation/metabolism regulation signal transduction histidine kinase
MRRADGSAFPVTFNASRAHLPAAVSDSLIEAPGDVELHVIAFRDVTGILAAQTHARVRATAGVLTEVAHTMGNPLAAIKCAGEVLTQAMAASTKEEERKITPADWTMISSMCDVIAEETARLDEKMKEFLERAGGDPEKLLELTAEAEEWSARLRMCPGGRSHGQDSPDR